MKTGRLLNIISSICFLSLSCTKVDSSCQFLTVSDYRNYAKENLPKGLRDFNFRGAGEDLTLNGNREGFKKFKLLPRYLRDVSNRTTNVEILGRNFKIPIGISPSGLHKRWHIQGENATVKAVAAAGSILIVSLASSITIEQIAAASPEAEKWFQVIICSNKSFTREMIQRAEAAGFKAIVLVVDAPVKSFRYHNIQNNHKDIYPMVHLGNLPKPLRSWDLDMANWEDVKEIMGYTHLPIIIKGLSSAQDVILAKSIGVKGVIVSNHGGRELDGAISTIEALHMMRQDHPELFKPEDGFDIYLDSGVRSGLDVFIALAMGAKFVFLGRPPLWGLYHSGQQGVEAVLEIFRNELETIMGQVGCDSVTCINPSLIKYFP